MRSIIRNINNSFHDYLRVESVNNCLGKETKTNRLDPRMVVTPIYGLKTTQEMKSQSIMVSHLNLQD